VNSAGHACYVERNYWMIDESDFAIFHLDENNSTKKSGTYLAFDYVKKTARKDEGLVFYLLE